jgi:uncharacterized protein
MVVSPVLLPPRRNTVRLMLLVDRTGSMAPYHPYIDHVMEAIRRAARMGATTVLFFRNTPGSSDQQHLLSELPDPFVVSVDSILHLIQPMREGYVYHDAALSDQCALTDVLGKIDPTNSVAIISDAGAVRRTLRMERLLDTLALVRALRDRTPSVVWLNPAARSQWIDTTAAQVARHVPMFPLTLAGMQSAVNVLRGQAVTLDRPL